MVDLTVTSNVRLNSNYNLIKLTQQDPLPDVWPGQFVQVKVEDSVGTFLRRPLSINYIDKEKNELWLLIQVVGKGTRQLSKLRTGDRLNLIYPLGKGFSIPHSVDSKLLLIGGGVGTAPMLMLGATLREKGFSPRFLLGARSAGDLLQLEDFARLGKVYTTTEDGSSGEKGFVTHHSLLNSERFDMIYTCGPEPMMHAVAAYAKRVGTPCEVSLENLMACGIGACLCCVENTVDGHVCVCTEGPVINIEKLKWQI